MAALKAIRLSFGHENERKEDEEEEEKFVEFFLLEVYGSFLLKGFLKVELDYGVYSLEKLFLLGFVVGDAGGGFRSLPLLREGSLSLLSVAGGWLAVKVSKNKKNVTHICLAYWTLKCKAFSSKLQDWRPAMAEVKRYCFCQSHQIKAHG
ncbi:hypothetical protein OIU78_022652 [Salix suchowensis]|nr:hypothetical protein OIU78_022652 [Salix suchowensis]